MQWIILESLVVLVLALAIVWWTVAPTRRRRDREAPREGGRDPDQ